MKELSYLLLKMVLLFSYFWVIVSQVVRLATAINAFAPANAVFNTGREKVSCRFSHMS